jgi:ubiquinone/menaquinone biosynthesis C-methylase UbiE
VPLLDHFSLIAPHYDRVFDRANVDALRRAVLPERGDRLLDVGGGTGRIARHFVESVDQICVLDPSAQMLRETQRKGICITQGEAERLPYPNAVFDRVIMVDAFHHLGSHPVAVDELVRVLTDGGRLVIEEPNISHWGVKLIALAERALLMQSQFFAPESIRSMLVSRGLRAWVEEQGTTSWIIAEKE